MSEPKKTGRPPIAATERKASVLSVRFTADERKKIEEAAEHHGLSASDWARQVLLWAMTVRGSGGGA